MSHESYRHSTGEVAPDEQFAYWCDALCDVYVPLSPERAAPQSFNGTIDGFVLPQLHGSIVAADAHEVSLTRSGLAARKGTPFYLNLLCSGEALVTQRGTTMHARPGDVYVVDCSAQWHVEFRSAFRMFCLEIDDTLLRGRLGRRGYLRASVVDGSRGAGRILANYMRLVQDLSPGDMLPMQELMTNHCSELLSRAQLLDEAVPHADRVRGEMLERILALVRRRLCDATLTPQSASEELGISRSYLFKILAEHGYSFSAYVRQCRLEACRRAIQTQAKRSIADIANDWGFSDVSSFSRAYRACYGHSPGQERTG